jgi:uncharacterized membrane protein
MRPRRVRFTIRGLMISVLVVAVLLSVPIRDCILLILCTTVLAIMFFCAYRLAITTHGWQRTIRTPAVKYRWNGQTGPDAAVIRHG